MATLRIRPGLRKSAPNPHRSRSPTLRFGARWRERLQHDQLLLEQEILSDDGSHAAGSAELRGCDGQVKQGEQEILHARDSRRSELQAPRNGVPGLDLATEF